MVMQRRVPQVHHVAAGAGCPDVFRGGEESAPWGHGKSLAAMRCGGDRTWSWKDGGGKIQVNGPFIFMVGDPG